MSVLRARTQLEKSLGKLKTQYEEIQSKADKKKDEVKMQMESVVNALEALNKSEKNI